MKKIPKEYQAISRITGEIIDTREFKTLKEMNPGEFQEVFRGLSKVIDSNNDVDYSRVKDLAKIWCFEEETICEVYKMMGGDLGETDRYLDLMNSEGTNNPNEVYTLWSEQTNSSPIEIKKN